MELSKYPKRGKVRTFHIEAIQIPIVYNKYGDYLYRSGSFAWDVESGRRNTVDGNKAFCYH